MSTARPGAPTPGTPLAVRVCCAIFHSDEVALIRRSRPGGDQHSLPGGLVHADEDVTTALARELAEELGLDVAALPRQPELRWAQDQLSTRPASDPLRRLHLIHVLPDLPARARETLAAAELDAEDDTRVVWVPAAQAARLHLYPAVGEVIGALPADRPPVLLPAMTDATFRWR